MEKDKETAVKQEYILEYYSNVRCEWVSELSGGSKFEWNYDYEKTLELFHQWSKRYPAYAWRVRNITDDYSIFKARREICKDCPYCKQDV